MFENSEDFLNTPPSEEFILTKSGTKSKEIK